MTRVECQRLLAEAALLAEGMLEIVDRGLVAKEARLVLCRVVDARMSIATGNIDLSLVTAVERSVNNLFAVIP